MSISRASRALLPVALLVAAALSGCFGARLAAEEPPGVRLQGVWKLNRAASDDPQQIVQRLRAEATKKIRRAMNAQGMGGEGPEGPGGPGQGQGRGRRGQGGGSYGAQPDELPPQAFGPGMDPLRNSPTMHALRDVMQRSDYLTIRQSPEQISFDYGTTTRTYTPGGRSVVSSENGVADQTSGWSGKEYVVYIRPQLGPAFSEEYALSPNGKQLIVKTHIGPFELQKVNLTRVYDATDTVVPNSRPSNE
jgi:hypothetical protein